MLAMHASPPLLLLLLLVLSLQHPALAAASPSSPTSTSSSQFPLAASHRLHTAFSTDSQQLDLHALAAAYSGRVAAVLGLAAQQVKVLGISTSPPSSNRHLLLAPNTVTITSVVSAASNTLEEAADLQLAVMAFQQQPEAELGFDFMSAFSISTGSVTLQVLGWPSPPSDQQRFRGPSRSLSSGTGSSVQHVNVHGAVMAVAYVLLFPLGALIARHRWLLGDRKLQSGMHLWFPLHLGLQLAGLVLCIVGFVYSWLYLPGDGSDLLHPEAWPGHDPHWCKSHQVLGTIAMAFTFLQVLSGFLRPSPTDTRLRPAWNLLHHNCGRLAILCSWFTTYTGIYMIHTSERYGSASYPLWLVPVALVMGSVVVADVHLTIARGRQAAPGLPEQLGLAELQVEDKGAPARFELGALQPDMEAASAQHAEGGRSLKAPPPCSMWTSYSLSLRDSALVAEYVSYNNPAAEDDDPTARDVGPEDLEVSTGPTQQPDRGA